MKKLFSLIILLMLAFPAGAAVQDSVSFVPEVVDTATVVTTERRFDSNYKEKYKGSEFNYERKEDNKKLSKFQEFLRWLSDFLSPGGSTEGGKLSVTEIVKRTVAVLVILVVIYLIARALLKKEGYWIFGKSRKKISAADIGIENIDTTDFQSLINATIQTADYRLGIRYYHLWLLKLLAYNNIIKWHKDKTNSDYLYEIKDEGLRDQFRYLSYIYDYSWYGEFSVSESDYIKAEKAFLETINKLKR